MIGRFAASLALALVIASVPTFAAVDGSARSWPQRPITYVIPYNPDGESDVTARLQGRYFESVAGQRAVIEYQPGAGGATAWARLGGAAPDGYTIMNVNFPHAVLQPAIEEVGYRTEDVNPVYVFHYTPDAVIVAADSPYRTLADLVADAKANPGAVTLGGSGTGSANHLAAATFDRMTGTATTYIPFRGSAPVLAALTGGQIDAAMSYSTQGIAAGERVRTLAVASEARLPALPDAPTLKELGHDVVGGAYRGVTVPKDTPAPLRTALSDIIGRINALPGFRRQMEDRGYVLVDVPVDEMDAWLAARKAEYADGIALLKGG